MCWSRSRSASRSCWENTRYWKQELGALGFNIGGVNTPASETPITPIIVGDGRLTMDFSRELFKEGVMGTGIAFPTVPEGKARIRTIMTADAYPRRTRPGAGDTEARGQADGHPWLMATVSEFADASLCAAISLELVDTSAMSRACAAMAADFLTHDTRIGVALQRGFALVCHQRPERCFWLRRAGRGLRAVPGDLHRSG